MAVAIEQFVKGLELCGVISAEKLRDVCDKLPRDHQNDAQELARELVKQKLLTKYQVQETYLGKAKNLVLGNYTIVDKIGQGGMGQVFKAEHRRMHRVVAVKVLPPALVNDQAAIARFEREVAAASKLNHPNIVTAYDADQANGVHFLVIELVDGSDLSALVKKNGPLPIERAVDYILQAARGLESAHAEGIVHRDIKPSNLLLDKKGTVKILDMGLARLSADGDAATQAELTTTGAVMGTVDYMAPEQALDTKKADARADIYSLGCTLYYLLTGKAAYGGESLTAKLLAHREQPIPSVRAVRPQAPEMVEAIFKKMVSKTVADRYQSATDVIADLRRCADRLAQLSEDLPAVNGSPGSAAVGLSKPVVIQKTWALSTKILGAVCGTIMAPILVTFLVKWLERDAGQTAQNAGPLHQAQPMISTLGVTPDVRSGSDEAEVERPLLLIAPFGAAQAKEYQQAWAAHLGTKVEISNTVGMHLRLIPPGEFMMGSTQAEVDALVASTEHAPWQELFRKEVPQHRVQITKPFYLGVYEVTQEHYREVMGGSPSHYSTEGAGAEVVRGLDTRQHPVEKVSWLDAVDFCNKLSEREGLKPYYSRAAEAVSMLGGSGYRLPTEAEWEYACRAGTTTHWSFGDDKMAWRQHGWFVRNAQQRPHPVGEFAANSYGLYDLHGNVWEWCWDCYGEYGTAADSDPTGPLAEGHRVLRGGAFNLEYIHARSASRAFHAPANRSIDDGFRLAKTIDAGG